MEAGLAALVTAFWLGILTSISPCPLATNIAAISFIGRDAASPRHVVVTGALYTAGRMITYLALGALLVASVLSIPQLSNFLQNYMNKLLGPLLVLVGMFLLGLIHFNFQTTGASERMERRLRGWGPAGAILLGMVFALSFCPVSAALFFGSLVPLSVQSGSAVVLPSLYGLGTALPVFLFAVLLGLGTQSVSRAFQKLTAVERWGRAVTGVVFVAVGIYLSLAYIYGVQFV